MPRRRKSDLSLYTSHARRERHRRSMEDYDQRQNRLMKERLRRRASRKRLKESQSISLNNGDYKQINRNIIGAGLVEVTTQERNSDTQRGETSKKTNRYMKEKLEGNNVSDSDAAESDDESKAVCVLKMEIEKEEMEINLDPIDCDIKEEGV